MVSDASGSLIDVNAATGQRIYRVCADYPAGVAYTAPGYTVPAYTDANTVNDDGTSVYSHR